MSPVTHIRFVSAALVVTGFSVTAVFGVACNPLPHDGIEITRSECVSCHEADYEAAAMPLHVDALPKSCGDCHDEHAWSPASRFDHEQHFELHGKHVSAACSACHTKGYGRGDTPKLCVDCHRSDYETVTKPSHATFATTCNDCHSETAWRPASFDHSWPLTGAHASAACGSCHVGDPPVYQGTSKLCVDCHRKDYDTSPFPGHSAFKTSCQDCHTTAAWTPASFEHPWALTGAHKGARCASCHVGDPPVYQGTSKLCVDCHRKDYDTSPFPGHADFPTTCQSCHATSGWKPATGGIHPESRFPIKSEPHSKVSCVNCHNASLGPNGKANADCVGCHTGKHTRAKMDEKHHEVAKYPSGSAPPNFCLSCHADGKN